MLWYLFPYGKWMKSCVSGAPSTMLVDFADGVCKLREPLIVFSAVPTFQDGAIPKPGSAAQDALNSPFVKCGRDGR